LSHDRDRLAESEAGGAPEETHPVGGLGLRRVVNRGFPPQRSREVAFLEEQGEEAEEDEDEHAMELSLARRRKFYTALPDVVEEGMRTPDEDEQETRERVTSMLLGLRRTSRGSANSSVPEKTTPAAHVVDEDELGEAAGATATSALVVRSGEQASGGRRVPAGAGRQAEQTGARAVATAGRSASAGRNRRGTWPTTSKMEQREVKAAPRPHPHPLMLAGIGGVLMLQAQPALAPALTQVLARARRVMIDSDSIDIEDLSAENCVICPAKAEPPPEADSSQAALSDRRCRRRVPPSPPALPAGGAASSGTPHRSPHESPKLCAQGASSSHTEGCGKKECGFRNFAGCALCSHGRPCSDAKCVACTNGVCVIAKNTFLTLADTDDEKEKAAGARRRCKSA
jgi:hypothetical protein